MKESCNFEVARLKKKKKDKEGGGGGGGGGGGHLVTFWLFGTFAMPFCTSGHVVGHENT